jgi:diketogulonate reductase-like aldo/keto reductase
MKPIQQISRRAANKWLGIGAISSLINPFSFIPSNDKIMNTRIIPSSGEKLPVIGLGTWQSFDVGNSVNERAPLKEVLNILINHGGSVIDSSPMYGRSEKVVGDLTTELKLKDKIFEATKVWTKGKAAGIGQMNNSIKLMHANPMDLMQVHNLQDWDTHLTTLKKWRAIGQVRYIGITHYHSGGYDEMEKIMKSEPIDFIQINYNLAVRDAAERILPLAKDKGIAVLINRPYEGGSLFRKSKGKALPDWSQEFDAKTWGQFFLKFILSHPAVTCVIPGTSKPKHMLDNVQAGFGELPSVEMHKKMTSIFR